MRSKKIRLIRFRCIKHNLDLKMIVIKLNNYKHYFSKFNRLHKRHSFDKPIEEEFNLTALAKLGALISSISKMSSLLTKIT